MPITNNSNNSDKSIVKEPEIDLQKIEEIKKINPEQDWSEKTGELLDSLPKIWTRGLLYFILIFVGIALPWAMLFKIEETGTARGRLEPKGKVIRLDAPVTGTVDKINVKQGDRITRNQILLELQSDLITERIKQEKIKLEGQKNRLNQLKLLENQLILAISTQQQQNQAQLIEKQAQIQDARRQIESSLAAYNLAEIELEKTQEQSQRYQTAFGQGIISKDRLLEIDKSLEQARERSLQRKYDIDRSRSNLIQQESSYNTLVSSGKLALLRTQEQLKNLNTDITILSSEISQTQTQIESFHFQLKQHVLKAPIDGIVFAMPVQSQGAVVQPGTKIAEIAPSGQPLILRAEIATNQSGFLQKDMDVKIKFDAYPFQNYGIVEGKLTQISPTSTASENNREASAAYELEIELSTTCIVVSSDCLNLRPGDTATAEVIIRQRRIIDFVLDPFKRLQKGDLKM